MRAPLRVRGLLVPLAALAATVAVALAFAAAAGAGDDRPAGVDVGAPAGPPEMLPDLKIQFLQVTLETGGDCNFTSTDLGIRIHFANTGDADAGPFDVEVNNVWQTIPEGLPAGEKGSAWFPGFIAFANNTGTVDVEEEVVESDETNNHFEGILPIPTLPPTCTPTPSPSPTPTVTPERPEILGDVDCNGEITSVDALLVLQLVAALLGELPCGGAADLDSDGAVSAIDASLILQIAAGLIGLF